MNHRRSILLFLLFSLQAGNHISRQKEITYVDLRKQCQNIREADPKEEEKERILGVKKLLLDGIDKMSEEMVFRKKDTYSVGNIDIIVTNCHFLPAVILGQLLNDLDRDDDGFFKIKTTGVGVP